MNKLHHKQKGATLLETVVYITILAVVLVVVVQSMLVVGRAYARVSTHRSLDRSITAVFDRMMHEIRAAESVQLGASAFGVNPGQLALESGGELVSFTVSNGTLQITEGGSVSNLLNNDIAVDSFIVEQINTGRGDGVRISLTLEASVGSYTKIETFYTSALLRGGY